MVENIVWCHGETTNLESDCSVYSILYLAPNSLFGLSFNLNSFRISFSLRRVTLVFPTLRSVFHLWHMKILGLFIKKVTRPSFAIIVGATNLKLLFLGLELGGS